MNRLISLSAAALIALALVSPAAAAPVTQLSPEDIDTTAAAIWSAIGIAIGCVILGVLYLFKKQIGGFPEDPEWVAPISIMLSSELPSDEPVDDAHAPAHH